MDTSDKQRIIWFSFSNKNEQILLVVQVSLLVCIGISSNVWFPINNYFPRIPIFEFASELPHFLTFFFSSFSILFLLISIVRGQPKVMLYLFSGFFLLTCLTDQMMWQPWSYYFLFIILTIAIYKDSNPNFSIEIIQFLLAFIYIFSGLQKVNAGFAFQTYPWLIEPITSLFEESVSSSINRTFFLAPVIETAAGVGLLFKRTQQISKVVLIGMHIFILLMLGPLGHNFNVVVWPWNICFILLLAICFDQDSTFTIRQFITSSLNRFKITATILFVLLPITSFFSIWPLHFSSALYSGNKVRTEIFLPSELSEQFPEQVKINLSEFENSITLNTWSNAELNIAVYPEINAHLKVFKELCTRFDVYSDEILITMYGRPDVFSGERDESSLFCDEISIMDNPIN